MLRTPPAVPPAGAVSRPLVPRLWGRRHLHPCCPNPLYTSLTVLQFWDLSVLAASTTMPLVRGTWVRDGADPPPPRWVLEVGVG